VRIYKFLKGSLVFETDGNGNANLVSSLERLVCPSCNHANCCNDCDGAQGADENNEETEDDAIDRQRYNAAVDGIESFLLALVSRGIADSDIPKISEALQTALDALEHEFAP
jgi:hypothetical protein